EGGPAGDVDDPAGNSEVEEVRDRELRQVGRSLEVDGQRPVPGRVPFVVRRIVGHRLVNAGVVDQHVDLAVELLERGVPDTARRGRVGEVAGDQLSAALGRVSADIV